MEEIQSLGPLSFQNLKVQSRVLYGRHLGSGKMLTSMLLEHSHGILNPLQSASASTDKDQSILPKLHFRSGVGNGAKEHEGNEAIGGHPSREPPSLVIPASMCDNYGMTWDLSDGTGHPSTWTDS